MVKKNKNRQSSESPIIENGGDSAESGDQKKGPSGCRCPHTQKAINLTSIKKGLKTSRLSGDCPGCMKDGIKQERIESAQNPGLWLCLQCGHQGCGRTEKQHALKHFNVVHSDPHCIAVNTTSWDVWCYSCEVELPSEYRKKLQECVKYLMNLDCPSSVSGKSGLSEGSKGMEESPPMPLADVTNMPHGIRTPKKKMMNLPRVRGLQNLGNTCFFNSVMQCLAQTPHFLELLQDIQQGGARFSLAGGSGLVQKSEGKKKGETEEEDKLPPLEGTLTKWGTLTETLASTLVELRQDDATTVSPQRLFLKLTTKCPQFAGGNQHDAHELLRHLLDEVRTEDVKRYWIGILDQYGLSRHDTHDTVDSSVSAQVRAYGRQANELWLLPDPVFRGFLVSTVECQDCLHSYHRMEPFYELSLPVTTNKPQPPIMRRKTRGDESFDVCGNLVNNSAPSKHQLKKERKWKHRGRGNHLQQQPPECNKARVVGEETIPEEANNATEKEANNAAESEQSDADVEDNVEQENRIGGKLSNGFDSPNSAVEENALGGEGDRNFNKELKECEKEECIFLSEKRALKNDACTNGATMEGTNEHLEELGERDIKINIEEKPTDVEKLCNGVCIQNSVTEKKDAQEENGVVSVCKQEEEYQNVNAEKKTSSKCVNNPRITLRNKILKKEIDFEKESFNPKQNELVDNKTYCINKEAKFLEQNKILVNGNVATDEYENKASSPEVCDRTKVGHDEADTMTSSDNVSSAKDPSSKDVPGKELCLSVSTAINSPCALGSPVSSTGTPSSVSSELNVDLSASNHAATNNWPVEESDRPYSRITFCNEDVSTTSNPEKQQAESPMENSSSTVQRTPCLESSYKDGSPLDQLAKEIALLGLAVRESPSHSDTCSARSLDDLKESKLAIPLDVPMCNGFASEPETEHLEEGDKSGTLAPRYQCEDKECSIESCLNQFTMLELMTGSCKVFCEKCTERLNKGKGGKMVATNSTKQYLVSNPPAVLVLHLKRFEVYQNMFRKTPRHVTFPMLLDIAPICNAKCRDLPTIRKGQTQVLYSLYGVVQHSGTLHGGHYSAYVKVRAPLKRDDMRWCFLPNNQSSEKLEELSKGASIPTEPLPGKWYHVSDSMVNEVNEDRVLHSQAYLLFYERIW